MKDQIVASLIAQETERQFCHIELIASENFVSQDILEAVGSILTNKYAEGYPNRRYYGGCEYIDKLEQLAIDRCKQLFECDHVNVQPHSGSQANMGVYMALLEPGDVVLGMDLNSGGHLTHGHPLSFSGKLYKFYGYGVDPQTETIDYEQVLQMALNHKPKLIVVGASAYTRIIDFSRFRAICDQVGAYMMVDMAHIAGLVAAKLHPSPVPYADFITSTTHKTLRGPRGGLILCKAEHAAMLDKRIFPGIQGGPLEHVIAGKAICFQEALQPEFITYQQMVLDNIQTLVSVFKDHHIPMVSGGSDNHMLLVDVKKGFGLTGKFAEKVLESVGITCNKNSIPFDDEKPATTSGIRIGTAAMTTRGFTTKEFTQVALWIIEVLSNPEDSSLLNSVKQAVKALTAQYPIVR